MFFIKIIMELWLPPLYSVNCNFGNRDWAITFMFLCSWMQTSCVVTCLGQCKVYGPGLMWWKHHDLASVYSAFHSGQFQSAHKTHSQTSLWGGKLYLKKKKYCVVFAIINFHLFFPFFFFDWALQLYACISIMSCFVSPKPSFLLSKDVFFFFPSTFRGGFWVDVYPNVATVTACFIIWNWKHKCKVRTNLCHNLAAPKAKLVRWQTAF